MSKREFFSRVDRDRYMREIQSVACLAEHPNVVNYFRGWQQDSHFYIQMELCEAGNLRMLLDSLKQPLDEHQVRYCYCTPLEVDWAPIHSSLLHSVWNYKPALGVGFIVVLVLE